MKDKELIYFTPVKCKQGTIWLTNFEYNKVKDEVCINCIIKPCCSTFCSEFYSSVGQSIGRKLNG